MEDMFSKLSKASLIVWVLFGIIVVSSVIGFIIIQKKKDKTTSILTTKKLVYGGMCVSIAFILSYIKFYNLPYGGSVTLASMFPIILYAMVFGPIAGIIAGASYGLLQVIQDPYVVHWAQAVLDYPLAFSFLGLAGFAPKFIKNIQVRTYIAVSIAILGRGMMHVIAGYIFFSQNIPEGRNAITNTLIYNGSYIIPELILTLFLSVILISTPIYMTLKKSADKTI